MAKTQHASGPIHYKLQISCILLANFLCTLPETLRNVDNVRHATNVPDYSKLALICWTLVVMGAKRQKKKQKKTRGRAIRKRAWKNVPDWQYGQMEIAVKCMNYQFCLQHQQQKPLSRGRWWVMGDGCDRGSHKKGGRPSRHWHNNT